MEVKRKDKNLVSFKEVKEGEVFEYINNIYIKCEEVYAVEIGVRNAIRLLDGRAIYCSKSDTVCIVSGKFIEE